MPRRRKPRPARIARHDDRPAHGFEGAREIGVRTVEDPYDPGNTIAVPANVRHDPLLRMFQRRDIDTAQMRAGEILRHAHEAIASSGVKAIDPGRETVDGESSGTSVPDRAMRAARRIAEARALLGWQAYRLLQAVICDGLNGSLIAAQSSVSVDRKAVQHQVRTSLDLLAILWGFASDPRRVRQRASMVGLVRERASWVHDETDVTITYRER